MTQHFLKDHSVSCVESIVSEGTRGKKEDLLGVCSKPKESGGGMDQGSSSKSSKRWSGSVYI